MVYKPLWAHSLNPVNFIEVSQVVFENHVLKVVKVYKIYKIYTIYKVNSYKLWNMCARQQVQIVIHPFYIHV